MFFDYFIDNIAKLKITLIDDEKYILDLFKDKKIIRMSFDLTPSNPEDRETFRRLDEMLKKSGIDRGKMSFENKERDCAIGFSKCSSLKVLFFSS